MIYNLEIYEDYIKSILKRMPILKTDQLLRCLVKTYKEMDDDLALQTLHALQRKGYVLLSPDGWAMTKGEYQAISQDKFNKGISDDDFFRLPNMSFKVEKYGPSSDYIDSFWLVADLMPMAMNFIKLEGSPWYFAFDTSAAPEKPPRLYEITRIPKDKEDTRALVLRTAGPKITDKDLQSKIIRIALIENPGHAWVVPYIGFKYICVLDGRAKSHFRIVETRTEDIWKECNEQNI